MRNIALSLVGVLFAVTALSAHHSYGGFFDPAQRTVRVEGDLLAVQYSSPHVLLRLRAADGVLYQVTWQSPLWLEQQAHVTKATFHVGDHLVVIGAPPRDATLREVTLIREVRRPRDGWSWRSTAPFAAPQ